MFPAVFADVCSMASKQERLEDLADDLTRALSIPFKPTSKGSVAFRDPLRVTEWSVPLVFDGHARFDRGGLIPATFAGHALWAGLRRSTSKGEDSRPWWNCTLTEHAARAILDSVAEEQQEGWVVGIDVLLESLEDEPELASVSNIKIAS
jgi:hypothetical protein